MIVFGLVVVVIAAAVFVALVRMQRCGWRREHLMIECCVVGPHEIHVFERDEERFDREMRQVSWVAKRIGRSMKEMNAAAARSAMVFREYFGNWQVGEREGEGT